MSTPAAIDRSPDPARVAELLRQPLSIIQGFAELLLTQQYDEYTRLELTRTLLAETEELSNVINRLLDAENHAYPTTQVSPRQPGTGSQI